MKYSGSNISDLSFTPNTVSVPPIQLRPWPDGVQLIIHQGASEYSEEAAQLVASGRGSLDFALGDARRRARLFGPRLDWSRVIVAWRSGVPVGYAQFHFAGRGPYAPSWSDWWREYGILHGFWASIVFRVAELWSWRSQFYLYGLHVMPQERGRGIGEALVSAVIQHARICGCAQVDLDVGPNFSVAQRLYVRCGFAVKRRANLGWMAKILPFKELNHMRCPVSREPVFLNDPPR